MSCILAGNSGVLCIMMRISIMKCLCVVV